MNMGEGNYCCRLCGRTISGNSWARHQHRARHIREGLIEQYVAPDGRLRYRKTTAGRAAADAVAGGQWRRREMPPTVPG